MKYPSLPIMQCDSNCGECCGPVICLPHEFDAVIKVAKERGIEPIRQGLTCPFYQKGECQVYEARPWVCRLFGHSERLVCSRGYNVNVNAGRVERFAEEYRYRVNVKECRYLHEAIPGWTHSELFSGLLRETTHEA